jgi:hypothetical protein
MPTASFQTPPPLGKGEVDSSILSCSTIFLNVFNVRSSKNFATMQTVAGWRQLAAVDSGTLLTQPNAKGPAGVAGP